MPAPGTRTAMNPEGVEKHPYVQGLDAMFLSDTYALIHPSQAVQPAWGVPCFEPDSTRHPPDFRPKAVGALTSTASGAGIRPPNRPLVFFIRLEI